jgi:ferredoxin-NADP reductase
VRGPFASYFVWRGEAPVLLVGGGSGVVPLMAMLRTHADSDSDTPVRMLYSVRHPEAAIYRAELARRAWQDGVELTMVYTRVAPPDAVRPAGRVDADLVAAVSWPPDVSPITYVCGPTPFVETVADLLVSAGHDPAAVRTERFGPSGGTR